MGFGGGGGGGTSIAGATDTTLNNPISNEVLTYDGTMSMWKNAVQEGGAPTLADLPAGSTLSVIYNAGWPDRPTARTDIIVQWIDFTAAAPVPIGALADHDIVLIPDGV